MREAGALGLFGGTFDPLHIGHLRLALEARETLGLAAVIFIPAGSPPLRDAPACTAADRLAMVENTLADLPGFAVDPSEVRSVTAGHGASYTFDTLQRQRAQQGPLRPLVLLLGADAFSRLEAWHRWRELFDLAHIAVATRPGHELKVSSGETALAREFAARRGSAADLARFPAGRIVPFAITALEISATAIRERLARGASVRHLVPDAVLDYIDSHQLYRISHGH